jgi:hypothetical protein
LSNLELFFFDPKYLQNEKVISLQPQKKIKYKSKTN